MQKKKPRVRARFIAFIIFAVAMLGGATLAYAPTAWFLDVRNHITLELQNAADHAVWVQPDIAVSNRSDITIFTMPDLKLQNRTGILAHTHIKPELTWGGKEAVNTKDLELTPGSIQVVITLSLELTGGSGCVTDDIQITNQEADGWLFAAEKYYYFNVSYSSVNFTATPNALFGLQFSDGLHNVTIGYDRNNEEYDLISGEDYAIIPLTNSSGWIDYDNAALTLNIIYPVYLTDQILDRNYGEEVTASAFCDGLWDSPAGTETFKIYNRGGLLQYSTTSNGTFTAGGDWMEACAYYYGFAQANQTWRKFQSFQAQYSLRFYEDVGGTWTPEDQFMQHAQNSNGGAEKYGGVGDWHLRWKVWGWDEQTDNYVLIGYVEGYMIDGDEGANDEWISIKNVVYGRGPTEANNATWNGFIEEEPAAQTREWLDIWINRVNASSIMGFRTGPFYYGMDDSGYLLWSTWTPQIDNATEAIIFTRLQDGYGNYTVASQFDLMKLEFELEFNAMGGSGETYRVCLEDVQVNDIKVADRGSLNSGVNTPSPNKPLVPDMAQGGLLAPLISAIQGLGAMIWASLSGTAGLLWGAIGDRLPWFTAFWEDLYGTLESGMTIFTTIWGYIIDLFRWGTDFIGLIVTPLEIVRDTWANLVYYTSDFFAADPSEVSLLLIMIVVFIPSIEALTRGDTSYVYNLAVRIWRVADWILTLMYNVASRVIGWIIEAIPL